MISQEEERPGPHEGMDEGGGKGQHWEAVNSRRSVFVTWVVALGAPGLRSGTCKGPGVGT